MRVLIFFSVFFFFSIYGLSQNLSPQEGFIHVEGGRIWYKVKGSGNKTPLLIIHGGPGGKGDCSFIEPFAAISIGRPIIFYDQLGSGRSDKPTDLSLWRLDRFVNEIDSLRTQLGLKQLHILGHSWGGSVLIEYLASRKPKGIISAIFASPLISTPTWMQDAKILLSQLPGNLRDTINKYEALADYDAASYVAATDSFYARHLSVKQWPALIAKECEGLQFNRLIYRYMWGSSEFNATGTLKTFDRTASLTQLKLPVLFIAGEFDEARPETMYRYGKLVKNAKVVILEKAAHQMQFDQPEKFSEAVAKFINSVD